MVGCTVAQGRGYPEVGIGPLDQALGSQGEEISCSEKNREQKISSVLACALQYHNLWAFSTVVVVTIHNWANACISVRRDNRSLMGYIAVP